MDADPTDRTGRRFTSKVTSKLQVTLPKALADEYGIRPGDDIAWVPAGPTVTVVPPRAARRRAVTPEQREERFLQQQARIRRAAQEPELVRRWREAFGEAEVAAGEPAGERAGSGAALRGWSRDDLYSDRGGR